MLNPAYVVQLASWCITLLLGGLRNLPPREAHTNLKPAAATVATSSKKALAVPSTLPGLRHWWHTHACRCSAAVASRGAVAADLLVAAAAAGTMAAAASILPEASMLLPRRACPRAMVATSSAMDHINAAHAWCGRPCGACPGPAGTAARAWRSVSDERNCPDAYAHPRLPV